MLVFALQYTAPIDAITVNKSLSVHKFELFEVEWRIVKDLVKVLKIFKDATTFFSSDNVPTIANVILTMDKIDDMLTKSTVTGQSTGQPITVASLSTGGTGNLIDTVHALSDNDIHPSVKMALLLAKKTLNRYYARTNESDVYRTAMILHPSLKLAYFRKRQWQQDWIDTAVDIARTEFTDYATRYSIQDNDDVIEIKVCCCIHVCSTSL
ncbi:hypothetical protein C8J56DRAFT_798239 [Mycena floridula]|nr:hypothetical protein C8J56DRAFT_798239 [Mycena floridula]